MTLQEKIDLQASATNKVFLFKEGIFYKVYNQGVFLLKECNYKVSVKQSSKTKLWYVSIGFPESVLEKLKLSYTFIKEQANKWKDKIDIRAYNALMNYEVNIND